MNVNELREEFDKKIEELKKEYNERLNELQSDEWEFEFPGSDILQNGYHLFGSGFVGDVGYIVKEDVENFYRQGNWFATQEEAEKERDRRQLLTEFRQFRDKCNKGDFLNYFIGLELSENKLYVISKRYLSSISSTLSIFHFNLFGFFENKEDCQKAIEIFGDRILELFLDDKSSN